MFKKLENDEMSNIKGGYLTFWGHFASIPVPIFIPTSKREAEQEAGFAFGLVTGK